MHDTKPAKHGDLDKLHCQLHNLPEQSQNTRTTTTEGKKWEQEHKDFMKQHAHALTPEDLATPDMKPLQSKLSDDIGLTKRQCEAVLLHVAKEQKEQKIKSWRQVTCALQVGASINFMTLEKNCFHACFLI